MHVSTRSVKSFYHYFSPLISSPEIPVEIVRPPKDISEAPGLDVVFEVELNKDRVDVKWMRNNMIIVQGDKYQMISEGKVHRLQVCEIRPRDQGEYRVVAKDKDAKAKLDLAGTKFVVVVCFLSSVHLKERCSCIWFTLQFFSQFLSSYSCTKNQNHRPESCNRCWKALHDDSSL